MTRFAFVDREKALYDVTVLCRLLKVSRSGFYAWLSRPKSERALADEVLTEQIREAFNANRKVYGSPRILTELADEGVHIGRKRIARLMRAADLVGCHRRKHPAASSRSARRSTRVSAWSIWRTTSSSSSPPTSPSTGRGHRAVGGCSRPPPVSRRIRTQWVTSGAWPAGELRSRESHCTTYGTTTRAV